MSPQTNTQQEQLDLRGAPRASVDFEVLVADGAERLIIHRVLDLSNKGIRLASREEAQMTNASFVPIRLGDIWRLVFRLTGATCFFHEVSAQVVCFHDDGSIGLSFIQPSEGTATFITNYVSDWIL